MALSDFVQSWEAGGAAARSDKARKSLASFMQNGDQGALASAYTNDPQAAMQAQQFTGAQKQSADQEFVKLSSVYAQSKDPATYAGWRQAGIAAGRLPPETPSALTDPADVEGSLKTAQAYAQAFGGGGQDGTPAAIRELQILQANPKLYEMDIARRQAGWQPKTLNTADGISVFNPQTQSAAPLNYGGQQAPQQQQVTQFNGPDGMPVRIGDDVPPEIRQQILSDPSAWQSAPNGATAQLPQRNVPPAQYGGGQRVMAPPKAATVPAGYRDDGRGGLTPIPGGPAQIAIDARSDAAAARKVADDLKASAKRQEAEARQAASQEASDALITAIDKLTGSPGYKYLGTAGGDFQTMLPFVRNNAKDAQAQLKNVGGQVALATMSRLKALSSTGATGFGSLTAPELSLLQNAIATLQSENISNAQLTESLKVIRDTMDKTAKWKPPQDAPAAGGGGAIWTRDANGKLVRGN